MKLTCTRPALSNALAAVIRATAKRATLPILNHLLLEAEHGQARLSATDLEITIISRLEARVEEDGNIAVPAQALSTLVKTLPSGDITLSQKAEDTLIVTTTLGQTPITGEMASEFPRAAVPDGNEPEIALPAKLFKAMIAQAVIAASNDEEHRPVYTGVLMQADNGLLTLAGFDGFRLTVCEATLSSAASLPESIVPAHALRTLLRILPDHGIVRVSVACKRAQVWFRAGDRTLLSRLIDGEFRYGRRNVPADFTTRVTLDTQAFAAHLKRAALFARENSDIVRLTVDPPGRLTVEAWDNDVGRYRGSASAEITGEEMHIFFYARQLADVLGVLDAPQMALHLNGPHKPAVIRPTGQDGTAANFTYVLGPLTINH